MATTTYMPAGGGRTDVVTGVYQKAGAPTNGTSGTAANLATKGSLLVDTTNGVLYINTNTSASPTWGAVAAAIVEATAIANVASPNGVAAVGSTPTKAEFDAVVLVANETKAQLNALLAAMRVAGLLAT